MGGSESVDGANTTANPQGPGRQYLDMSERGASAQRFANVSVFIGFIIRIKVAQESPKGDGGVCIVGLHGIRPECGRVAWVRCEGCCCIV